MSLPPCTLVAEASHLDVGRGLAIVDLDVRLAPSPQCRFDAGAALLAREEGRDPPDVIVWRAEVQGSESYLGGAVGGVAFDVPAHERAPMRVRVRAVLRGERFVAAPLSTDPDVHVDAVPFSASAQSVWGAHAIAGVVHWIDVGVPMVVTTDPTRDHEPLTIDERVSIDPRDAPAVLIVDGGPILGDAPSHESAATQWRTRRAELAAGGAPALSTLLDDLPVSIATASDAEGVQEALDEAALAALSASGSRDPLVAAIGQRLATAIASGMSSCDRKELGARFPEHWTAASPALIATGVLEDATSGCPRLSDLLAVNHHDLDASSMGLEALRRAMATSPSDWPKVGRATQARAPLSPAQGHRLHGRRRIAFALFIALGVALAALVGLWIQRSRAARA